MKHLPTPVARRRQRGITLIEALVAMAVMAIGLLGLLGVQSTLRSNSDIAKQRAEATRLAQQAMEQWRGYVTMNSLADPTLVDFTDIVTTTDNDPVAFPELVGSNTTYTRVRTVTNMPAPAEAPGRALKVMVRWTDRNGTQQSVQLNSMVAGIEPALTGTVHIPPGTSDYQTPQGRKRGIPPGARTFPDNPRYSGFLPPGLTGVAWRFDNVTGVITLCTTTETSNSTLTYANVICTDQRAILVSGYLRFANSMGRQPGADDARTANGVLEPGYSVRFNQTSPSAYANTGRQCAYATISTPENYVAYYCAVPTIQLPASPVEAIDGNVWVDGPSIAAADTEVSASMRRVCRYFNPRGYEQLKDPRTNQNLLIIAAGDGTNAFTCNITEADRTTRVTWMHQPAN